MVWLEAVGLDNDGMQAVELAMQTVNASLIARIHSSPTEHLVQIQGTIFRGISFVPYRMGNTSVAGV